jgi:hypothetical protein
MIKRYKNFVKENSLFDSKSTEPVFKNTYYKRDYTIVNKIESLKKFIVYDLGLKEIIDKRIKSLSIQKDVNDDYQNPLEILALTGKYPEIKYINGRWETEIFKYTNKVLDDEGKYHPVNKLNTNYSDLANLLYDIIKSLGKESEIKDINVNELKDWLINFTKENDLNSIINSFDIKKYTYSNRKRSEVGEAAENFVSDYFQDIGFTLLYQGGDGDFIDMRFGIDLIMRYKERVVTIQVKKSEIDAKSSFLEKKYNRIDYYCSPKLVTEMDENGFEIINKKVIVFSKMNPEGKII